MKRLWTLAAAALLASGAMAAEPVAVPTGAGTIYVTPLPGNAIRLSPVENPRASHSAVAGEAGEPRSLSSLPRIKRPAVLNSSMNAKEFVANGDGFGLHIDRSNGDITMIAFNGDTLARIPVKRGRSALEALKANSGETLNIRVPEDYRFFGGGEYGKALALSDTLTMYNRPNYGYTEGDSRLNQTNINIPYLLGSAPGGKDAFAILFDDPARSTISITPGDIAFTSDSSLPTAITFIGGRTLSGVTRNFTAAAGRQDLPPFWALGYITSKYGYHSDKETLGAVDSLKREGYPVDGIILDLYWYGKETDMGRLEWMKSQFPDPAAMLDSLRRLGVRTTLIHQPYINKTGALDNYQMLAADTLLVTDSLGQVMDVHTWVGDAGMFDVSNPATRAWLQSRLRDLTKDGVEGWWGDLGEPEQHRLGMLHKNGLGTIDYHNIYGNDWSRLVYEYLRTDYPERRPFVMMRGGSTGLQKYSVFPWTGDVSRSWGGLKPQIKLTLNSGLSGLGYMSSDIGGFAVEADRVTDPELYARWMQFGVFSPILRTHAQAKPEPYHYPQLHDQLLDLVKMRYRWLPYNYTLAYENSTEGLPLVRPINFYGFCNPKDEAAAKDYEETEYLWGKNVLVAPVTDPGQKMKKVFFPSEGDCSQLRDWVYWFDTNRHYAQGTVAEVPTPLKEFPLFVRSGSFIPQYDRNIENTDQYDPAYLTIKYFADGEESAARYYDDNRKSPDALLKGDYRFIDLSAKPVMKSATPKGAKGKKAAASALAGYDIRINLEFDYPGAPVEQHYIFEAIGIPRPVKATLNGKPLPFKYDARTKTAVFILDFDDLADLSIKF